MPSYMYSCSASRHLPTRLLQLCPIRSTFIHTTTLIFATIHTAALLIKDLGPRDHIAPTLKQLRWLPIHARIAFKISLVVYRGVQYVHWVMHKCIMVKVGGKYT